MLNLKSYRRKCEEIEAIRSGHLIEFLARERKRKIAADKHRHQKKLGSRKKSKTSPSHPDTGRPMRFRNGCEPIRADVDLLQLKSPMNMHKSNETVTSSRAVKHRRGNKRRVPSTSTSGQEYIPYRHDESRQSGFLYCHRDWGYHRSVAACSSCAVDSRSSPAAMAHAYLDWATHLAYSPANACNSWTRPSARRSGCELRYRGAIKVETPNAASNRCRRTDVSPAKSGKMAVSTSSIRLFCCNSNGGTTRHRRARHFPAARGHGRIHRAADPRHVLAVEFSVHESGSLSTAPSTQAG